MDQVNTLKRVFKFNCKNFYLGNYLKEEEQELRWVTSEKKVFSLRS